MVAVAVKQRTIAEIERDLERARASRVEDDADPKIRETLAEYERLRESDVDRGNSVVEGRIEAAWRAVDQARRAAAARRADVDERIRDLKAEIDYVKTPPRPADEVLEALEREFEEAKIAILAVDDDEEVAELRAAVAEVNRRNLSREDNLLSIEQQQLLAQRLERRQRLLRARRLDLRDARHRLGLRINQRRRELYEAVARPAYAKLLEALRPAIAEAERLHYLHRSFEVTDRDIERIVDPALNFSEQRLGQILHVLEQASRS